MLNNTYKLKDTIDVFVSETESPDKVLIIFHRMTTRDRIEMVAGRAVAEFLALLDGKTPTFSILRKMGQFDKLSATELINFLLAQHFLVNVSCHAMLSQRYQRQIAYFDDLVLDRPGHETQALLENKKIVLLGCGAVGGGIVELLARAGVNSFVLVDYKKFTECSFSKDIYSSLFDVGKDKTEVLSAFLKSINPNIETVCHNDMLIPHTDLSCWIPADSSVVINSCDEPYIGHTSLKLGRYLQANDIPMYVAGGFDAHLMSSGELIYPPYTPCIDCAQQTFTKALGGWKPTYSETSTGSTRQAEIETHAINHYVAGGAGGMAASSGFSANFAAMRILQFLVEDSAFDFETIRHEYLINAGHTTQFRMRRQEGCVVCNKET